jgi:hypothetical protein
MPKPKLSWKFCIFETWSKSNNYMPNATAAPPPKLLFKNLILIIQNPSLFSSNYQNVYCQEEKAKKKFQFFF